MAWRFLHQWHRGLSARSSRRALRYAALDVRLGIVVWLTRFACPSALALLGCYRIHIAEVAHWPGFRELVTVFGREVCFTAVAATANFNHCFVAAFDFHVVKVT